MKRETAVLTQEIAGISSRFSQFLSWMPDPAGAALPASARGAFPEMLLDAHISAKLARLKDEVIVRDWSVSPASSADEDIATARMVEGVLKRVDMPSLLSGMLSALEHGFSLLEVIWEFKGGLWTVQAVKCRPQEYIRFKGDATPVLMGDTGARDLTENYKYIVHRNEQAGDNPYGSPLLARCYWPWQFKKAGMRFWLTATEKYGVPTVMALFSSASDTDAERRAGELAGALSAIQNDAAVALANVDDVRTIESRGQAADFLSLVELCNREMSKAITGEILTSDTGSGGSYALAGEHTRTLEQKGKRAAQAVAATLNSTLIRWLTELNAGADANPPYFQFDLTDDAPWDVVKDALDRGIPISRNALYERYHLPRPEEGETELPPQKAE